MRNPSFSVGSLSFGGDSARFQGPSELPRARASLYASGMKTIRWLLWFPLLALAAALAHAQALQPVTTVEGVSEYRLPNGWRVLTVPDPSIDTITIHLTVLVGSRHESYGEKGMAHLLEHLLFKDSNKFQNIKQELTRRGARYNGTTAYDRTT